MGINCKNYFRTTGEGGWSWLVVAAAFVIQIMGGGSHYAQGVYVSLFLEEFKESKSKTAFVGSIFGACLMMSAPLSAMCAEKFGNRTTSLAATILATLGLLLSAYANSIWYMYVTFSVMTGLGLGLSYMPGVKAVGEHFDKKRGIAMGLACAGVGMGSFLFPPIINSLIQNLGLKSTLIVHGVITFVSLGLSSLALIPCEKTSQRTNLVEDAIDAERGADGSEVPSVIKPNGQQTKSLWRDSRFTLLCANQVFGWLACIIVIMDLAPYGKTELGLEAHHASMLLSTSGALNVLGRIVGGFLIVGLSQYFSALTYYSALNVMLVVSTFAIPFFNNYVGLLTLSGFFGLGLSCYSAVLADMVADMFGKEAIAFSFGYFVLFQGIGALIGAPLSGILHDATHTYKYSFGLAGFFYIIGVLLLVAVRVKNNFVQRKYRKSAALLKPNTAKTITSILSMARQNASNISLDKYGPSEIIRVPSSNILANNRKDISHSNSGELAPLQPIWIAGGEGEEIDVPRLELIQVHAENESDHRGSLVNADTSMNLETLNNKRNSVNGSNSSLWNKPNLMSVNSVPGSEEVGMEESKMLTPSGSTLTIEPRSRRVSMMSISEDPIPEEPLTAQEVYAAEEMPMLRPEKAPVPTEEDEADEVNSLAPEEIEQLLEPEDFTPGSSCLTPLPPPLSPYPASYACSPPVGSNFPPVNSWAGSRLGLEAESTSASRTPNPEMVIVNNWSRQSREASGMASLSTSVPKADSSFAASGWVLKQEELSEALRRQQERGESTWGVEDTPLLDESNTNQEKHRSTRSSKRTSLNVTVEEAEALWPMDEEMAEVDKDAKDIKYLPLNAGSGDELSESSDDYWLESNQTTIQSCISEADMDLRSLRRLGVDVKQNKQ